MKIIKTPIADLLIIEPQIFNDDRGYFFESYNQKKFNDVNINSLFVQDNESKSTRGTIRGLHYQLSPYSQSKLVRVIDGVVYDVAVDLRKNSPTFGQWFGVELSAENKRMFYVPQGFAHGFSVLSDSAIFSYKCDNLYHRESERGIKYNDLTLNIDWKIKPEEAIISPKDQVHPLFNDAEMNF